MYFYPSRRKFLETSIKTPLVLSAGLTTGHVLAEDSKSFTPHQRTTLQQICYLLYPFPGLGDAPYRRTVDAFELSLRKQPEKQQLILAGINQLDAMSDTNWCDSPEAKQIEYLKSIETDDFFISVLAFANSEIMNDKQVWDHIGYEGSSLEKGGYLHRGFNDIDWL